MVLSEIDADEKLTDETGRIAALQRYQVLDTPREESFDKITSLVRTVLGVPICAISLVDRERQWFKSIQGLDAAETPRSVAFCDHTIRNRQAMVVHDALADPLFAENPLVTDDPSIRSYAGVPLRTPDGYNLGALCVIDTQPKEFTSAQIGILTEFAGLVMDELELRTIAHKDFLTGAATRRAFVEAAAREIDRFQRTRRPSSLIMFDIDHFKSVNDRFGHGVGDVVLTKVAVTCDTQLRPNDLLGRVGGEEFAILLPDTDIHNALSAAERLRREIEALTFATPGLRVTASFGIAAILPTDDFQSWSGAADEALYEAKHSGRNRTVVRER